MRQNIEMHKLGIKYQWYFLIFISALFSLSSRNLSINKNLIPDSIFYKGKIYLLDKDAKVKIINEDIDNDGEKDLLKVYIVYGAFKDKDKRPFYLIYDLKTGKPKLIYTIRGNMKAGKIKVIQACQKIKVLVIFSYGGNHYTNIFIYRYQKEKLIPLLEEGSPCPIVLDRKKGKLIIKIGRSNWGAKVREKDGKKYNWSFASEPLWEVYKWEKDKFIYSKSLSSVSKRGEIGEFKTCLSYWSYKFNPNIVEGLLLWTFGVRVEDFLSEDSSLSTMLMGK